MATTITAVLLSCADYSPEKLYLKIRNGAQINPDGDAVTIDAPGEFSIEIAEDISDHTWLEAELREANDVALWKGFAVLEDAEWTLQEYLAVVEGGGTVEINSDLTEAY